MTDSTRLPAVLVGGLMVLLAIAALAASAAQAAPPPPEELNFSRQKPFLPHDGSVSAIEVTVPGAKSAKPEIAGSITNGDGDLAKVTVTKGKVSIASVKAPGKYSGSVNLNPKDPGGAKTKITLEVRDNWGWALVALVIGLVLALFSELWLTRWRPRGQLRKKLDRLDARLDATATQQSEGLGVVMSGWAAPRIQGEKSVLVGLRERIESGLKEAKSDEERKRFGPEGDEMKKVDTLVENYEALLGYAGQIAQDFAVLCSRLDPDSKQREFKEGALAERITGLLKSRTITYAAALTDQEAEAKDIRTVLHAAAQLDESYRRLGEKPDLSQAIKQKIDSRRQQLLRYDATADDIHAQHDVYAEIVKGIYGGEEPKTVQTVVASLASLSTPGTAPVQAPMAAAHPGPTPPEIAPVILTSPKNGTVWNRYFELGNWAYSIISGAVVTVAGLSALYFSNTTFGSTADYIGMVLWGSTVQGGISLVRQVLPGAAQSLNAGG